MKKRKKPIILSALILALFSYTGAQAQMRGDTAAMRQRQEQMLQKMSTDLKLTSVQTDSLRAIQAEFAPRMRAIFMDQSMSQDDKMAQRQSLMDARNARVQGVLGADLYKKYQDWMAANRPQRGGGNRR